MMCTRDKVFTIRGIEDCEGRSFTKTGFFEVDTGEQRAWTVQLTESTEKNPQRPLPGLPGGPPGPLPPGALPGAAPLTPPGAIKK